MPNGQRANGTMTISWPSFTVNSKEVAGNPSGTVYQIRNGVLNVELEPNDAALPTGTYYTVRFAWNTGGTSTQFWVVPTVAFTIPISAVRASHPSAPQFAVSVSQILPAGNVGDCMVRTLTGWFPRQCPGGGEVSGQFIKEIDSVISVSIPASEHGLTRDFYVQVYGEDGSPVEPEDIIFTETGVTVTFAVAQSGNIVLRSLPSEFQFNFTSQTSISIPAESHLIRSVMAVNCRETDGEVVQTGAINFTPAPISIGGVFGQSVDISISFAIPQSGSCVVFGE